MLRSIGPISPHHKSGVRDVDCIMHVIEGAELLALQ